MKYSLKELISQIGSPDLSQYKKFTPLFIAEAEKGLNWTEWDKDVFNDYFEKAHNSVAYLGQGVLRPHHKEKIKKNWMKLAPHLKAIASSQDIPLWEEYKTIRKIIRDCTEDNMQIATNRMLACLQPKILCTEVDLKKVNELVDYIQAYTDANISSYDRNNWEKASYSLLSLFHQLFPHKHYMEFAYMPWKLLELFKENLNRGTIPTYWLTSWNENDFKLHDFFSKYDTIDWNNKRNNKFKIGDVVYLYCSRPERRIRYKAQIIKLNVTPEEEIDDHDYSLSTSPKPPSQYRPFRLKRIDSINVEFLNYDNLQRKGLKGSIRTPRTLNGELLQYINSIWEKCDNDFDEIPNPETVFEGAKKEIIVNRYERNHEAREKSIAAHGCKCAVCGMDFEKTYGEIGRGFIHVHHIVPLSSIGKEYELNPITDLVPVCPNCHAMLHRQDPPYDVDSLKALGHFK